jgi:hypothetical protein
MKTLAGLSMVFVAAAWVIATASPTTLALIEMILIALLYFIRRRRLSQDTPGRRPQRRATQGGSIGMCSANHATTRAA